MRNFKGLAKPQIVLLIGIALSGCAHVTVKDKEVCADLGGAGAHCAHTYINEKRDIKKVDWDKERVGWMCIRADDFSDTEDSIDELCRNTNYCDYETRVKISDFKFFMRPLVRKARAARKLYNDSESTTR